MNRQPITMTATKAAPTSYAWIANKPENANLTPAEIKPKAAALMTRLIQSGLFIIA